MDAATLASQKDRIAGVLDAIDGKEGLDRLDAFANQVLNSDGTYLFPREGEYGTANAAYEITLHGVSVIAWSERDAVDLWVASAKRETRSITCTLDSIDRIRNGIAPPPAHSP
ncbi:hypothetical protein [Shimia sp. MIT910701]|uniref:hypothetical protein n=1 Tax=Shimia sp. MIT910701 TaxID=3096987 RepID=UPI00399A706E